jgi:uncharacterized protein YoxC
MRFKILSVMRGFLSQKHDKGEVGMIIEISVAIIALAFAALVIYLIAMIQTLRGLLGQVNHTLVHVRSQLDDMGGEAKKVIEHTNQMGADLQKKMEALNSVFKAVENVGDVLENKTASFKEESTAQALKSESVKVKSESIAASLASASAKAEKPKDNELHRVADFLELVGLSIRLWQKLKKRR